MENRGAVRVISYRLTWAGASRWRSYVALALLIGATAGLGMAMIAGARRTQSSFPEFLASTHPSDLTVTAPGSGSDPTLGRRLRGLPHVSHVSQLANLAVAPIDAHDTPSPLIVQQRVISGGSVARADFDQDRLTPVVGRLADPKKADEFDATAKAARLLHLRVGQRVRMGAFTVAQTADIAQGKPVKPIRTAELTLVGIVQPNDTVVQDDVDAAGARQFLFFTPAFSRPLASCCDLGGGIGLQLDNGAADVGAVESEVEHALPKGGGYYVEVSSIREAQAERAIEPQSAALGVFGLIAAASALVISALTIDRLIVAGANDTATLRALGAGRATLTGDAAVPLVLAALAGTLLAIAVAVLLSPLFPIGPARGFVPDGGVSLDWTVLAYGGLITILVLSLFTWATARRAARRTAVADEPSERRSRLAGVVDASGLGVAASVGVRSALERGRPRGSVPMRSVVVGATLAVAVVAATITFGASLHRLVSRPALYGWNWDNEIVTPGGGQYISLEKVAPQLRSDPDVAAWSGYYFDTLRIDGQTVPILGTEPYATVTPPLLSGHEVDGRDQIVLGELTLAQLGKHVGDTVEVGYGQSKTRPVRIVGTATMPAVGPPTELHLSVGTGAEADFRFIPSDVLNGQHKAGLFSPNAIFVRFRPGVDQRAAAARLRSIGRAASTDDSGSLQVVGVQRPAEIVNYRAMGNTPLLLAAGIALGATVGLGLALITSVRRRRPTLSVLKALGFTRRQVASSVSWQSNTVVVGGAIVGLPLGIIVGRIAWISFAHQLHVFPRVTVPAAAVAILVGGAVVLATALSVIPPRIAARTPPAELLRVE